MEKNKKKRKIKKTGMAAIAAPILAAGTVAVVSVYQSGIDFTPSGEQQDFQTNQVVFDDNKDTVGRNQDNNDNSSLFEKDQNANNRKNNQDKQGADYLFESKNLPDGVSTASFVENNDQNIFTGETINNNSSSGYNIVADASNADTILPSNPSVNGTGNGSGNGSGNGNGNGNGSGNTDKPTPTPTPDPTPDDPTPTPDPTPGRYDGFEDPDGGVGDSKKPLFPGNGIKTDEYNENKVTPKVDKEGNIAVYIGKMSNSDGVFLYKGRTITKETIYQSLDTKVDGTDGIMYFWSTDDLGKYIKIDSVSFDDGKTWQTEFPVTVPMNIKDNKMCIRVYYRLHESDGWTLYGDSQKGLEYEVESGRLIVLSEKLPKLSSGETTRIDSSKMVMDIVGTKYPATGDLVNLYGFQANYLNEKDFNDAEKTYLNCLFPGWTENGKKVSWFYKMTDGRHILEPEKKVSLEAGYKVKLLYEWLDENYQSDGSMLCYMQTLTGYDKNVLVGMREGSLLDKIKYKELIIPKYIQSINMDKDQETYADYVKIPDTVVYIDNCVDAKKGYIVDSDNPYFSSNTEGILTNKKGTEFLGVPSGIKEITIPKKITKLALTSKNSLHTINLKADAVEKIPEISYENLSNCKIIVSDKILDKYIQENYKQFSKGTNICVASLKEPEITYTVKSDAIVSNQGRLRKMLNTGRTSENLSSEISTIAENAFSEAKDVESITLPEDGSLVDLEKGCFNGSNIKSIRCYDKKQFDNIAGQIEDAGGTNSITIELLETTKKGFSYSSVWKDNKVTTTLIRAPKNITEYDGMIMESEEEAVEITEIGESAFANCENLQVVTLPESTKSIGYKAFENCTSLEMVMINATDSISIKNKAFAGCSSLRIIASNAEHGEMDEEYDPFEDCTSELAPKKFWVPIVADGYNGYCIQFVPGVDVVRYDVVDVGQKGKLIYGVNADDEPWLVLGSTKAMDDTIKLPTSTSEIFSSSMKGTVSQSGSYSVNWEQLSDLWIDEEAFMGSDLGGDLVFHDFCGLGASAFLGCENITSVSLEGENTVLDQNVFASCTNLQTVYIKDVSSKSGLYHGMFYECKKLNHITLGNTEPMKLFIYSGSSGTQFRFNPDWTIEEEQEKLVFSVPAESKEKYVKAWRYYFAGGYDPYTNVADYSVLYDVARWDYYFENGSFPTDEWAEQEVKNRLLNAENRIRRMLGMNASSSLEEMFTYKTDWYGNVILTGAPSGITEVDLANTDFNLPKEWYIDYIGSNAFKNCSGLSKVTMEPWLGGIYTNAFSGVTGDSLTLDFTASMRPLQLVKDTEDGESGPFTFGADENIIHILVPEDTEKDYINSWIYPFAGYEDLDEMRAAVKLELMESDSTVTDLEVDAEIAERLLPIEKRLRKMFGMDEITDTSDMATELECYSKEEALKQKEEQQKKGETSESGNESEVINGNEKVSGQSGESENGEGDSSENNKKNEKTLNSGEETKE